MLILKTVALEPMHDYGISQRIQQISKDVLSPLSVSSARRYRLASQIVSLCTSTREMIAFCRSERGNMSDQRIDLPQGSLELLILKTLALEQQHGWAISERIQQISCDVLQVRQGSLYPALHRLERRGWIKAQWGVSENNRRAKYYSLTRTGRKRLEANTEVWRKLSAAVSQILDTV